MVPPVLGEHRLDDDRLIFGDAGREPRPGGVPGRASQQAGTAGRVSRARVIRPTDHLGELAGGGDDADFGQARWYPGDHPVLNLSISPLLNTRPSGCSSLSLSHPIATGLAHVRRAGKLLPVNAWDDDGLSVDLPDGPGTGTLVVWRDDIPSNPVEVTRLLPIGITCDQVKAALSQMFSITPDPAVPCVPLAPGIPLQLGVSRDTTGINPVIVALVNQLPLTFSFRVSGVPQEDLFAMGTSNVGANPVPTPSQTGTLLIKPELFPQEKSAQPKPFSVQLQVTAVIPDCGGANTVNAGTPYSCQQLPLPIPTIAVIFQDSNFSSDEPMLILLPSTTRVPGLDGLQHIDDNNSSPIGMAKSTLGDAISGLHTTLSLLATVAGFAGLPGADELSLLADLAGKINAVAHPVIDSSGGSRTKDLDDSVAESHWYGDDDFDDECGSMILLAAPGFGQVEVFSDDDFSSRGAVFRMPPERIIAAVPDFENMRSPFHQIALPYLDPNADTVDDFDDDIESVRIT